MQRLFARAAYQSQSRRKHFSSSWEHTLLCVHPWFWSTQDLANSQVTVITTLSSQCKKSTQFLKRQCLSCHFPSENTQPCWRFWFLSFLNLVLYKCPHRTSPEVTKWQVQYFIFLFPDMLYVHLTPSVLHVQDRTASCYCFPSHILYVALQITFSFQTVLNSFIQEIFMVWGIS